MSLSGKYLPIMLLLFLPIMTYGQADTSERLVDDELWIDPGLNPGNDYQRVVVWFDRQLLGSGDSYMKRVARMKGQAKSESAKQTIALLKIISNYNFGRVKTALESQQKAGNVRNIDQHWIINGFSCEVNEDGLKALQEMHDVARIFQKRPLFIPSGPDRGPEYLSELPVSSFEPSKADSVPWNIAQMRAQEVWNEYGITGKNTLNVVHDFGFKLDIPPLAATLYVNSAEIPGNGIDDDNNGYIDDYHGFNFDTGDASVNNPFIRRGTIIHGNACAAMISGTFATGTDMVIGIAPESKWAPVIGSGNIESAVEWALEQGADTYSMSFSQPNLGEYRSHWRKIMEHGALCGLVFISGAGNFAAGNGYAPVPVQMRVPEDIPEAVLGVAGVGQDGNRPVFSSQGPVEWNTNHYREGRVNKPDFATLNFQISCVDLEGNLSNQASGNSFAGPHMAGIVSLMLSANPELWPWEVKDILKTVAKDIGEPGFDFQSGNGFVNAYDAVTEVLRRMK